MHVSRSKKRSKEKSNAKGGKLRKNQQRRRKSHLGRSGSDGVGWPRSWRNKGFSGGQKDSLGQVLLVDKRIVEN